MEVDVDLSDLTGLVLLDERPEVQDAGVVDHDLERPEIGLDAVQEILERGRIGDVERIAGAVQLGRGGHGRRRVDVADRHPHPTFAERGGDGAADATRAARDGGHLALQRSRRRRHAPTPYPGAP